MDPSVSYYLLILETGEEVLLRIKQMMKKFYELSEYSSCILKGKKPQYSRFILAHLHLLIFYFSLNRK